MKGYGTNEERTIEFFRKKFNREFSFEEARQINERLTAVYTLLAKWDREQNAIVSINADNSGDFSAG